jgi:Family of unknown function (DUF6152)
MTKAITGSCVVMILLSTSIQAHHSFAAQFDPKKPTTITGPVTKIEWANPHIYFYVDAKDAAGSLANWAVEMGNPLSLIRLGWTRNDMKVGDVVIVDGWLARDGSKLMNAKSVMLGGRKMFAGSGQSTNP